MKFDTVIIGGGLSGLTCGIALAERGQKVMVVSAGQSGLHFSCGSFELLGYVDGKPVERPLEAVKQLAPNHPYSKIGEAIEGYAAEAKTLLQEAGLAVEGQASRNHLRLTPVGVLKPAWLTLENLLTLADERALAGRKIALFNIRGFLDFPVAYIAGGLTGMGASVSVYTISTPQLEYARRSPSEMRATNVARYVNNRESVFEVVAEINRRIGGAQMVLLPAVLGLAGVESIQQLKENVTLPVSFVATMPPSVPGVRVQTRLRQRLQALGGTCLMNDTVIGGCFVENRLTAVKTRKLEDTLLEAEHFVLASGSFMSGGLTSNYHTISEPIFHLDVAAEQDRDRWYTDSFFDAQRYMTFGVERDGRFRVRREGRTVENLFAAGSVLSGNDALKQADGTGVSMLTALAVAHNILKQ